MPGKKNCMKTGFSEKCMCVVLAFYLLAYGICLSAPQTDFFGISLNPDVPTSIAYRNDGRMDSFFSVLNPLDDYHIEQLYGKAAGSKTHSSNVFGMYAGFQLLCNRLNGVRDDWRRALLQGDVVCHLCSTLIIDYVHLVDGEKADNTFT